MIAIKKCALCHSNLNAKNKSKEHIIPNAIGGRRKTNWFICDACNNKRGASWDAELAKQLNWFSLALGISRERGEVPRQIVETLEGERLWQLSDGSFVPEKPSYSEKDKDGKITISMTSSSLADARQRLKGVARKYPKFDVQRALDEMEVKTSFLSSPLHVNLSLGGPAAGRSLVKTAFAFASECGVTHEQCEKASSYLLDESSSEFPFGYSYISDLVINRPEKKIFHCVSLHADPETRRIYSYIEYFGLFRIVVLLGEKYGGPYKNVCHAINPVDGTSLGLCVKEIETEELQEVLAGNGFDHAKHKLAAEYAFPIILERSRERTLESFMRQGFEHAGKQLGLKEGEIIPPEKAAQFTALMMQKINPYLEHLVRNGRTKAND